MASSMLSTSDWPIKMMIKGASDTTAGGVAMYISNALQFSVITNLQLTVNECENIWIKLHDSNVIISNIYRHPKNDAQVFIMH